MRANAPAAAGALALILRKNSAQVRYWIWLTASLKFLIPFSLLIALGTRLEWRSAPTIQPEISYSMVAVSQPFAEPAASIPQVVANLPQEPSFVPVVLLLIWLYGFTALLWSRARQWSRVRAAVRSAVPSRIEARIPVLTSSDLFEPGV